MPPLERPAADTWVTSVRRPDDFDDFWVGIMREADAIPLNVAMDPVPLRSTPTVDTFELGYDSIDGVRIAGWYCRPSVDVVPPPYPGLLIMPGYVSEPTLPKSWAAKGYAAIGVAPRGKLRSNSQFNPGYPGLLIHDIVDRHTYAYRGFYVDAARAVDVMRTLPEVDPARIGVQGGSQGGALTVTTAALRPNAVACGAAGAPYLCGFMDAASLTHSYPYEEITEYLRRYPERADAVRDTVAYFDGINFAQFITCPMLISVGLADDVCPPETGFNLYDALPGPKEIHAYPRCAHDAGSYWEMANIVDFLAGHLRPAGVEQ